MRPSSLLRTLLNWLPWRRSVPPALAGTLALLRLLPRVHLARTVSLGFVVALNMLLPIGLTVVTGLLIGSIPAAVEGGPDSPAARLTLIWRPSLARLFWRCGCWVRPRRCSAWPSAATWISICRSA